LPKVAVQRVNPDILEWSDLTVLLFQFAPPLSLSELDPIGRPVGSAGKAGDFHERFHLNGAVILYADVMTQSIQKFLAVSEYRRKKQLAYNQEHHITPRSVSRAVEESLSSRHATTDKAHAFLSESAGDLDLNETIRELEEEMLAAANNLEFEKAALLRDQLRELGRAIAGREPVKQPKAPARKPVSYSKSRKRVEG
jgi:hypothetical protein